MATFTKYGLGLAAAQRFPGEAIAEYAGLKSLQYYRPGSPTAPLMVFLPGGAHLGRIAYGDPSSSPTDFLDYWLERAGIGLLALSYPSDHPATCLPPRDLTIARWAEWIASATKKALEDTPSREVIVAMWSMAGRSVAAVNSTLGRAGIVPKCFLSLAATPPLPGLIPIQPGGEMLTTQGLWARTPESAPANDRDPITLGFLAELAGLAKLNGREIIEREVYLNQYICNTPIMLRGTAQRYSSDGEYWAPGEAEIDMSTVRFSAFPFTAMLVPTDQTDESHVLGDRAAWHFCNVQKIRADVSGRHFSSKDWSKLRALVQGLPGKLHREMHGGHFFFVGEDGARRTVVHLSDIIAEVEKLTGELSNLLYKARRLEASREIVVNGERQSEHAFG
ncbi:hypothetical protein [Sinorhizobium meliloti]|uniref:hypothetical protein n=1 Tax=Rhizobium meliloti TaxID=382 RepID=UPI000FD841A9|nr:hypothetical protein [Sinorhizobium meliloti]RVK92342.1 hypothetical protein CN152_25060 [Sinorhizobium meliloti]RVN44885.1 hypothetical protein CN113_19905 [Sinorhizobium meliloti]